MEIIKTSREVIDEEVKLTDKEIKKHMETLYPAGIELTYIDYRDSLDEHLELVEDILQDGLWKLEEQAMDWYLDSEGHGLEHAFTTLKEHLDTEGKAFTGETQESIRDWCYDHDTSDITGGLIKNTRSQYFYYDTGLYLENMDENTPKEIAKYLKIDYKKNKAKLQELVNNAFYGGALTILFWDDLGFIPELETEKYKAVSFHKATLCIMDRFQGSGWFVETDETIELELEPKSIHIDEGSSGYSFTGQVCGLVGGLFAGITLLKDKTKNLVKKQGSDKLSKALEIEQGYEESWKKDKKCSYSDSNPNRHDTEYQNIPMSAGWKCKECGRLWLD